LINQAIFIPGKRKYLLIAYQIGMSYLKDIKEKLVEENLHFELVFTEKMKDRELAECLSQQKMGSYLYIALPWDELYSVKRTVEEIGFSEEEFQCIGYGEKNIHVFCCRCHGVNTVIHEIVEIRCQHCQLQLEISDHYSSLRNAYLGYVAKL
jgi:dimethylamine monooxygenase subunit C